MKKFKTKLTNAQCLDMVRIIDHIQTNVIEPSAEEQLHIAVLTEVSTSIKKKLIDFSKEYKISLSPAQAFALRLLYVEYIIGSAEVKNELHNRLLRLSNDVHQFYQ